MNHDILSVKIITNLYTLHKKLVDKFTIILKILMHIILWLSKISTSDDKW